MCSESETSAPELSAVKAHLPLLHTHNSQHGELDLRSTKERCLHIIF